MYQGVNVSIHLFKARDFTFHFINLSGFFPSQTSGSNDMIDRTVPESNGK